MIHTTIKRYHQLMKPGIIRGNQLATWARFLLASKWHIDWKTLLGITEGTMLMIGSACVFILFGFISASNALLNYFKLIFVLWILIIAAVLTTCAAFYILKSEKRRL